MSVAVKGRGTVELLAVFTRSLQTQQRTLLVPRFPHSGKPEIWPAASVSLLVFPSLFRALRLLLKHRGSSAPIQTGKPGAVCAPSLPEPLPWGAFRCFLHSSCLSLARQAARCPPLPAADPSFPRAGGGEADGAA